MPSLALICVVGFLAAIYSHHRAAALALSVAGLIVVGLRLPWIPTHLMMEFFLFLGIVIAWIGLFVRTRSNDGAFDGYWARYAPLGRWLLILMYFYGTFHKLNPAFLSPESSCAIPFVEGIPVLSRFAHEEWFQHAAIFGTLLVEAAAMCLLLIPRLKYYGMLMGMTFHWFIGISGYGTLAHFSAFALALHGFFVPSDAPSRFLEDNLLPPWTKARRFRQCLTVLIVIPPFAFAVAGSWTLMNIHFGFFALILILFVLRYGRSTENSLPAPYVSPSVAANVLAIGFLIHGAAPYLGLRTTAAVQIWTAFFRRNSKKKTSWRRFIFRLETSISVQPASVVIDDDCIPAMNVGDSPQNVTFFMLSPSSSALACLPSSLMRRRRSFWESAFLMESS